jgi:hypothetical protein
MARKGYVVTGTDANVYPPMSTFLESEGIRIFQGYKPENLPEDADLIVIGNAMSRGNAEVEAVLERNLRYKSLPETMKEFFGSIGEILLPIVNTILEILTGIFNLINLFLKPIATLVGKIFSLLNISFWTNMMNMENSMPNYGKYDMGMIRESIHPHTNSNIKTGDIYIQSDAANTDDAAKELASKFVNSVGNTNVFEFVVGSNIQGAA